MGLKVESTDSGDPLPGLMGNEGSSDPFSPRRVPQPPLNYTAGVSVFAWSITSQPLHLLSCTHRFAKIISVQNCSVRKAGWIERYSD